MCIGESSSFGVVRLWPTLVIHERTHQERVVRDIMRDLGARVARLEATARAHEATIAVFVNPRMLVKRRRIAEEPVHFYVLGAGPNPESNVIVPAWAASARGYIALARYRDSDLASPRFRARLTDSLREAHRIWTRRIRQDDMNMRLDLKKRRREAAQANRALATISAVARSEMDFH